MFATILTEFLRGKSQRSALRQLCLTPTAQRNLEIGREHSHLVAFGFDEHVCEDGNRVFALYNALEKLQFSQKLILPDNEFHRLVGDLGGVGVRCLTDPVNQE